MTTMAISRNTAAHYFPPIHGTNWSEAEPRGSRTERALIRRRAPGARSAPDDCTNPHPLPAPTPPSLPRVSNYHSMANSLLQAVADCRYQQVKFFLDSGVRMTTKESNVLVAALHIRDDQKREKMFNFLMKKGADCGTGSGKRVDTGGRSVLSWACALGRSAQLKLILDACMGDIDFHAGDKDGLTPLHHAVLSGDKASVVMIIQAMDKYRLGVDIPDKNGLTPYIYAKRLGLYGIVNVLSTDGRACPAQFDTVTYRSADEWAEIGAQERRRKARLEKARAIAWRKIRGRLPTLNASEATGYFKLPNLKLTTSDNYTRDISMRELSMIQERNSGSDGFSLGLLPGYNTRKDQHHYRGVSKRPGNASDRSQASTGTSQGSSSNSSSQASSQGDKANPVKSKMASKDAVDAVSAKNMSTALSLLSIAQTDTASHPDSFVSSQFDTSKVAEYSGVLSSITDLMNILSEQQSQSFRKTVRAPNPPTPQAPNKAALAKPRVSTLAILLGKERTNGQNGPKKGRRKQQPTTGKRGTDNRNSRAVKRKSYAVLPPIETQ